VYRRAKAMPDIRLRVTYLATERGYRASPPIPVPNYTARDRKTLYTSVNKPCSDRKSNQRPT